MSEEYLTVSDQLSLARGVRAATKTALRAVAAAGGGWRFRGRLIRAGEVRYVLHEAAGLTIPAATLQAAVALGQIRNPNSAILIAR